MQQHVAAPFTADGVFPKEGKSNFPTDGKSGATSYGKMNIWQNAFIFILVSMETLYERIAQNINKSLVTLYNPCTISKTSGTGAGKPRWSADFLKLSTPPFTHFLAASFTRKTLRGDAGGNFEIEGFFLRENGNIAQQNGQAICCRTEVKSQIVLKCLDKAKRRELFLPSCNYTWLAQATETTLDRSNGLGQPTYILYI